MNTKIMLLLGILLLKACGLAEEHYYFTFYNNSGSPVTLYVDELYPDTLLIQNKPFMRIIQPGSNFKESHWGTWKEKFKGIEKISVFIIHADTLEKYNWEEIRDGYRILQRYDLSYEDLKRLNFQVYYPPNEAMKDIEMYPPYPDNN